MRRKPVSEEIVAPSKTIQLDLSKSSLMASHCLSPTARMQLFLHLRDLGHGTFLIFREARFKKQLQCLPGSSTDFQHSTRWNHPGEVALYAVIIVLGLALDISFTRACILMGLTPL
jgi:hypothetical protein